MLYAEVPAVFPSVLRSRPHKSRRLVTADCGRIYYPASTPVCEELRLDTATPSEPTDDGAKDDGAMSVEVVGVTVDASVTDDASATVDANVTLTPVRQLHAGATVDSSVTADVGAIVDASVAADASDSEE